MSNLRWGAGLSMTFKTSTNCQTLPCGLLPVSGSRELIEWQEGLNPISVSHGTDRRNTKAWVLDGSLSTARKEVSNEGWNGESSGAPRAYICLGCQIEGEVSKPVTIEMVRRE